MELVQEKKMSQTLEEHASLGIYVHVPFCYTRCDFCAFYEKQPAGGEIEEYLSTIEKEAYRYGRDLRAETIFWGGGTPGLLAARDMKRLGELLVKHFGQPREWTVEMAPASVTATKLKTLREIGVTRISLGVQSFDDKILQALGRDHSRKQIDRAYDMIRQEGFRSVNIDLMFALPGQSLVQWESDLRELALRAPDHLSTYCLTFEEDTRLYAKLAAGQVSRETRKEADFYEFTWHRLEEMGYAQYEVSNFAQEGHRCIHNINTWNMQEWIGLGPSAASQYDHRRYTNVADLSTWKKGVLSDRPTFFENDPLSNDLLCQDAIIFGMRMKEGISLPNLKNRFGTETVRKYLPVLAELQSDGLLSLTETHIQPTRQGMLLADWIGERVISL